MRGLGAGAGAAAEEKKTLLSAHPIQLSYRPMSASNDLVRVSSPGRTASVDTRVMRVNLMGSARSRASLSLSPPPEGLD